MADGAPLVGVLVGFAGALRGEGLAVGSGDVLTYCAAMAPLDPTDLLDLYWAGRTTLVTSRDHIPVYDRVFRRFFLDQADALPEPVRRAARTAAASDSVVRVPLAGPGDEQRGQRVRLGLVGSDAEVLRQKAFAACTPEELAALRRIAARVRLAPPRRRTRRTAPARSAGRTPDLRRTVRAMLRQHGEPSTLYWRRRRLRRRPLILIVDVSGSMADYSRSLLQFAYSARRASARVEAFCFGTRLTRITGALRHRRVDDALARAARTVFDWEGGTRIGDSLTEFVRDFGRRGVCRGGIVVVCSDGLDRGDPRVLAGAMERLARLSHRVAWLNPHHDAGRRPSSVGMMVVAPHVDLLLSGHNLSSLEEFAARLPELG